MQLRRLLVFYHISACCFTAVLWHNKFHVYWSCNVSQPIREHQCAVSSHSENDRQVWNINLLKCCAVAKVIMSLSSNSQCSSIMPIWSVPCSLQPHTWHLPDWLEQSVQNIKTQVKICFDVHIIVYHITQSLAWVMYTCENITMSSTHIHFHVCLALIKRSVQTFKIYKDTLWCTYHCLAHQ